MDVGDVQRESGAEGEFAEGAIGKENGDGVAVAFESFLGLGEDFFVRQVTAIPSAMEVVGEVLKLNGESGAVIRAEFTGREFAEKVLQMKVGFAKIELEVLEVHESL